MDYDKCELERHEVSLMCAEHPKTTLNRKAAEAEAVTSGCSINLS